MSLPPTKDSSLILIGDPFTFPADLFLKKLNEESPGIIVVGGMASGAYAPYENTLFSNEETFNQGAIGLTLFGDVQINPVVSQGCKPIGRYFVITKAEKNIISQLGGKPALQQLQEMIVNMPPSEQKFLQNGLQG